MRNPVNSYKPQKEPAFKVGDLVRVPAQEPGKIGLLVFYQHHPSWPSPHTFQVLFGDKGPYWYNEAHFVRVSK